MVAQWVTYTPSLRASLDVAVAQEWNAAQADGGHQLAMNHWGDVSAAEYRSLLAGNKRQRREWAKHAPATALHQPTVPPHMVPNAVDWRGTQADSPVKNQAACGSCWVSVWLLRC